MRAEGRHGVRRSVAGPAGGRALRDVTEVGLYHLIRTRPNNALPQLLGRALATGQRAVAIRDSAGRHAGRYRMATHWDSRIAKAPRTAHGEAELEADLADHGRCSARRRASFS
jgi:hypothetical protein